MTPSAAHELAFELRRFVAPAIVLAVAAMAVATVGWQTEPEATSPEPPAALAAAGADEPTDADEAEGHRSGQPVVHIRR